MEVQKHPERYLSLINYIPQVYLSKLHTKIKRQEHKRRNCENERGVKGRRERETETERDREERERFHSLNHVSAEPRNPIRVSLLSGWDARTSTITYYFSGYVLDFFKKKKIKGLVR